MIEIHSLRSYWTRRINDLGYFVDIGTMKNRESKNPAFTSTPVCGYISCKIVD